MFGIDLHAVPGRSLPEVIRGFAKEVLTNAKEIERDFSIASGGGGKQDFRFLQAHGTVLRGADGAKFGAVIVVSDVTRLRRLEQVRKDFAANVSHELRTPLTTIKGFVETLQTSGFEIKDEARRFLCIIAAQVERLSSIIDDLMTLTLIEREEEAKALSLEELPVLETIQAAARHYEAQAGAKHIAIVVKGENTVIASINAPLIEQAIGNLIDNAVKYSGSGTTVEVALSIKNSECVIAVKDQGPGIPQEHLDRLFERFYRVDKARSRKLGGTGLGLSIVKHIVGAHKGTVLVESAVGKGSTFSIVLPAKRTD
jgi:two-component system phosphate regulon sensor histidine kinase PhoR